MNSNYQKLVEYKRNGLTEEEHSGILIYANQNEIIQKYGEDNDYPYFLRSCAKPLQASLIVDYELDKKYNLTEEEIAICTASHVGERIHTELIKGLLKKIGLDESYLKCGIHLPLSKTRQKEMLLNSENPSAIHNNCSGKHTMMLAICKLNGWNLNNYYELNHPLQKAIKQKIYKLCEIKNEYPMTKDGCGVPIFSMPLYNILKGYFNLFFDKKYTKITNAFLNYPYIIGGEGRTDTKIIQNSPNIVAKTGAGGLFVTIDVKHKDGFIVKIADCDMKSREIVVIEFLKKLKRADIKYDNKIKTINGDIVGEIKTLF